MSIDVFLTDAQRRLADDANDWVEASLYRDPGREDQPESEGLRLLRKLAEAGWTGYAVPAAYDGKDDVVQSRALVILREAVSRGSSLADTMLALQGLGSYPITFAGTEEQKRRYLPSVARGARIAAFALTEPDAGSDLAGIRTRAEQRGERYVLNGTKSFISNAGIAHFYVVFASTDPEAGTKGLGAFLVDADTLGLSLVERTELMAPHPIGTIALRNCSIPMAQRLGQEGQGIQIALATLDKFRPTVGAAACGLARRALDEAIVYARERRQFGSAIAEYQAIRFKLAEMATELDAARLLVYRSAHAADTTDARTTLESAMAKYYATEAAQRIVDQALQIHGGLGVKVGTTVERLYREVRALRIYEGTSEIQRLVIAREVLNRHGGRDAQ